MKLLQILYPGLGGHSSVAFSLIEGDEHKKYSHSLIGYGIEPPSVGIVEKIKGLSVGFKSVLKSNGIDYKSQTKVYRLLKEEKPDMIIMHSTSLIFVVWWYSLLYSVKWVSVEHQSNFAKSIKDWFYSFSILMLSPKIIFLTDQYLKEIKSKFKVFTPINKIVVINNGINIRKFKPNEINSNSEIVYSMISRVNPLRDHKTLIYAFHEISLTYSSKLYIAGDGSSLKELLRLVRQLNIEEKVVFTGILDEGGIIQLLNKTDVYIHSSLAENLSTSLLQVMACKIPIIATNIPGINNLLVNGEDALLFEPQNVKELVFKMKNLLKDSRLSELIKNNAYNKLISNYDSNLMFKKYEAILK